MTIEISPEASNVAIASIQRYFSENMDEPIGSLEAGSLLSFVLKEIGPLVYNKAVAEPLCRFLWKLTSAKIAVSASIN